MKTDVKKEQALKSIDDYIDRHRKIQLDGTAIWHGAINAGASLDAFSIQAFLLFKNNLHLPQA